MPHIWNNIVVVTVDDLVPSFYTTISCLQQELYRYKELDYGIKQVRKGGNGRKMLIAFDSLQKFIQDALGDPRKVSTPLDTYYKTDADAIRFYNQYRFEDNTGLSLKHIEEYVTNASVLKAAMVLKEAREHERKTKGGSLKGIMLSLCNDVAHFNKSLKTNYKGLQHTLPSSEKRFKETFKEFSNGFNYANLISGKLRNENRKLVSDGLLEFLNNLFAGQLHKPTRTEVAKQYESFLAGYMEVISQETGEVYDPKNFKPLSQNTIINYLGKWQDKVATHKLRSGDRQKYMGDYKPYHSLDRPQYAGSIISIDDRQPPFKYDNLNNRIWFYNGIDLASEAFTCWVYGKSKEGIITEFYRQLIRNYTSWGINLPAELEAESNLNSSFTNTFLQPGAMFEHVRIEANNARGKRIERYFGNLRYGSEKQREGWLARPFARNEANQIGNNTAPVVPYNTIAQNSLKDIEDWNNSPHAVHADKTRWEVFLEMQHPQLKPTNWSAILPYLGYKTQTSCGLNGIIKLNNEEYLLGLDGEVLLGEKLIGMMKILAGENIDVYWLDGNNGEVLKASIFLRNTDRPICEAIAKPKYQRAIIERTERDNQNYEMMSAYVASIEGYARMKTASINKLLIIDKTPRTLNRGFVINELKRYEPTIHIGAEVETMEEIPEAFSEMEPMPKSNLKDRF